MLSDGIRKAYNPAVLDVLADAGPPLTVQYEGRTYRLGFPTQAAKARYENLVLKAETDMVLRQKAFLPPDDYQMRCDKLSEQINGRAFATGEPLWMKYSLSPTGWLLWVQSLFGEHHPEITAEDVVKLLSAKGEEVRFLLGAVVPSFFAWTLDLGAALVERVPEGDRAKLTAELEKARLALPAALARLGLTA